MVQKRQDEFEEASPNLTLAIVVLALAAALPCVPVAVGMAGNLGLPGPVTVGLNLFGTVVIVLKGASIAYGIGRHSTG